MREVKRLRRAFVAAAIGCALVGGSVSGGDQAQAAPLAGGKVPGRIPFAILSTLHDFSQSSTISNVRINGQNPAVVELEGSLTLEFNFDGGESIALVHILLDLDNSGTVTPADVEIGEPEAFVDNSDLDADPAVGAFRISAPTFQVLPVVAQYVVALRGTSGWAICPVTVTAPSPSYSISGVVTSPPNVPGIAVVAMFFTGGREEGLVVATITDANGQFYIPVPSALANDSAVVLAADFLDVTGTFIFSMPVLVRVDGHITGISLELIPADRWIRAHLVDDSGNPVAGILLGLETDSPNIGARTNADGVAILRAVGVDRARVAADPGMLLPEFSAGTGEEVTLVQGDTVDVTVRIYRNDATIQGIVYMDGRPKPGIRVYASNEVAYTRGWTDISGQFSLAVCSRAGTGSYWVNVERPEGYMVQGPGQAIPAGTTGVRFDLVRASAEVYGYVTDANTGQPVARANVWVSSQTFGQGDETDESGYFSIPVVPGTYEIGCTAQGYLPYFGHIEVPGGRVRYDIALTPFTPGVITGHVYSNQNAPLAGIHVLAEGGEPFFSHYQTETGPDGSYRLDGLAPGSYVLWAYGDLWSRRYYPNASDYSMAARVWVGSGTTIQGIDFVLPPGGAIRGFIRDAASGLPIPAADIWATDANASWRTYQATSHADGSYTLGGLPPGSYYLTAAAWNLGYLQQNYNQKFPWEYSDTLNVRESRYRDGVDFALTKGCAVHGYVYDIENFYQPVPNAQVTIQSSDGSVTRVTSSGPNGDYLFVGEVPPGEYYVWVSAAGYAEQWYRESPNRASAVTLHLENGQMFDHIDFFLRKGAAVGKADRSPTPTDFALHCVYPNPFNPIAFVRYEVPVRTEITLEILDAAGRHVKLLERRTVTPGRYQVRWDGTDDRAEPVSSGLYLFVLRAGDRRLVTKATLLR
ncbi:MAG: carboxypeptidase regulatory-like domain-containing protein [candidate division KSB1 bacterium]|nr:carboxypeptidase regulatory-like domain-containing protein [candidate division KSB1 bacterium]